MKKLRAKIKRTEQKLSNLREQERDRNSRKFVTCGDCERRTQIRKTVFVQTNHYIEPYSCTGGAYWVTSTGNEEFLCAKCGVRNRMLSDEAQELVKFRSLFAEIQQAHDRYGEPSRGPSVNI